MEKRNDWQDESYIRFVPEVSDEEECPDCNGTGRDPWDGGQCDRCAGTGVISKE